MKYAMNFNIFAAINSHVERPDNHKSKSLMIKLKNALKHEFISWQEYLHKDDFQFSESIIDYNDKQSDLNLQPLSSKYYNIKHNARTWSRHSALISLWEEQRH